VGNYNKSPSRTSPQNTKKHLPAFQRFPRQIQFKKHRAQLAARLSRFNTAIYVNKMWMVFSKKRDYVNNFFKLFLEPGLTAKLLTANHINDRVIIKSSLKIR